MPHPTLQRYFQELLDAHGSMLMAMLRRLCRNSHDAEDVFQETAVRVWRNLSSRPRLRSPRAWMMTIGYRAFLDSRVRMKKHQELDCPVDSRAIPPDQTAERSEDCDRIQAAIAQLPEAMREVVVLHYVGGLTLRQTAAAMELSQGTVKSRLNAALNNLRSLLQ